jgi:hypothetical protein
MRPAEIMYGDVGSFRLHTPGKDSRLLWLQLQTLNTTISPLVTKSKQNLLTEISVVTW